MKSTSLLFPTGSRTTEQWQRTQTTFSYCESGNQNYFISSNCNQNCFLIHRYICFPVLFLLLLLFLLKHINIIQVFKFTSERKQICLLYKLGEHSHLQVSIFICRNDSQKPTLNFSFLHFCLILFLYTKRDVFKYISYFPTISDKYFIDEVLITSIIHYYKFYENHKENLKVNFSDLTLLIESCSG